MRTRRGGHAGSLALGGRRKKSRRRGSRRKGSRRGGSRRRGSRRRILRGGWPWSSKKGLLTTTERVLREERPGRWDVERGIWVYGAEPPLQAIDEPLQGNEEARAGWYAPLPLKDASGRPLPAASDDSWLEGSDSADVWFPASGDEGDRKIAEWIPPPRRTTRRNTPPPRPNDGGAALARHYYGTNP